MANPERFGICWSIQLRHVRRVDISAPRRLPKSVLPSRKDSNLWTSRSGIRPTTSLLLEGTRGTAPRVDKYEPSKIDTQGHDGLFSPYLADDAATWIWDVAEKEFRLKEHRTAIVRNPLDDSDPHQSWETHFFNALLGIVQLGGELSRPRSGYDKKQTHANPHVHGAHSTSQADELWLFVIETDLSPTVERSHGECWPQVMVIQHPELRRT